MSQLSPPSPPHTWRYFEAGGVSQVALEDGADLKALPQLDQKLWVALACPVKGTHLDEDSLSLVDSDQDGRIRAPEILEALRWSEQVFVDMDLLLERKDELWMRQLRQDTPEGQAVRSVVQHVLSQKGRDFFTVADAVGARELLYAMAFNGDGVVPPASAQDPEVRQLLEDILATVGGVEDRSGQQGVDAAHLEAFWEALVGYQAWWKHAEEDEDTVVPLGSQTAPAVEAFAVVRAKIDDYFTRCALAAFDERAAAHLAGEENRWIDVAGRTLTRSDEQIAAFPLAQVGPGRALPLKEGLNPAWTAPMERFLDKSVTPLLGELDVLTRAQWRDLKGRFAAYEAWLHDKKGQAVEPLGIERIRALLESDLHTRAQALLARDLELADEADALQSVERAARYRRDLGELLHNFINFRDFYLPQRSAIFQAGVLYLDSRSCELCLRVEDINKHSAMAQTSYTWLAYCQCTRKGTPGTLSIVAAFTDGDDEFLTVGRNGLFYDRDGKDWDATITKVIQQPISIRQAFWEPYKRLARFVSQQIEKFAQEQDKDISQKANQSFTQQFQEAQAAVKKPAGPKAPADPKAPAAQEASMAQKGFDIARFAGIFAAVGLALGFIASAATMLVTGFLSLRLWQMPLAVAGVLLLISGPSMLLAAFKLHQRNLAPLLDANGWAINGRTRLNIPFGTSLTHMAKMPQGAQRVRGDLHPDHKRSPWPWLLLVVLVCAGALLWDMGLLPQWLGLRQPPEPAPISAPQAAPAPVPTPTPAPKP